MHTPIYTHDDLLETHNLYLFGTHVPKGSYKVPVLSTGNNTVMGRIAALVLSTKNDQTPINNEIQVADEKRKKPMLHISSINQESKALTEKITKKALSRKKKVCSQQHKEKYIITKNIPQNRVSH